MKLDERTLRVLEFDKILQRVEERCTCSLGRELALSLRPTSEFPVILEWQQETGEAVRLLESVGEAPFGGLHDVRSAVERAIVGGILLPEQLLDLGDTLRGTRLLRSYLLQKDSHSTDSRSTSGEGAESLLADRALGMNVFPDLEHEIGRCIGDDAEVLDSASPVLAKIRQQLRTLQGRVRERLEEVLRNATVHKIVQESLITLRNGRYVIPVKQECRASLPGIVHDQSGSGATLFVEPMVVVELNNQIRQGEAEEQEETERILQELSRLVGDRGLEIIHTVGVAAEIDFIFAKARLSLDWRCVEPQLNTEGWVNIRAGRHPLLKGTVVPVDIWLGQEFTALVITGPNTGGKTVTLKTVGLLTAMAQAGLHVPAKDGTELCIFDNIFADIGDEQSIEQDLSTFSSHMSNIVRILRHATPDSLVLLDELGAGTDPTEGAALAMSILEYLIDLRCRTVATTHYSELKSFAYTESHTQNASVEFDVETLRPTYRLSIGVAGSSNAFAIARRLGLAEGIINRAAARLTKDEIKVEELIRAVEENRRDAVRDREEAARVRAEMELLRERYQEAFNKLQSRREVLLSEARREAEQLLTESRREVEQLIGELRRHQQDHLEEAAQEARRRIIERQDQLTELIPVAAEPEIPLSSVSSERDHKPLRKGDTVRIVSLDQVAEVLADGDGKDDVLLQAGPMRLTRPSSDLERISPRRAPTMTKSSPYVFLSHSKSAQIGTELDLRGLTVDEAIGRLVKYIDDCMLAGLPWARVIHGKGTGALRRAVREYLVGLPQVSNFRYGEVGEGGDGVTVVQF